MNTADGGAGVLIGGSSDRAGIQHDHFGLIRIAGARKAAPEQLTLDGRAVRLGRAASEVLHVIRRHSDDYTVRLTAILRASGSRFRITEGSKPL